MAGGNQGFGAEVLPDPSVQTDRVMQMLWMHNQKQAQFGALQQQRELTRQKGLTDYLDKRLDNKNFATGDPEVDPLIDQQLSAIHQKYAKQIAANPNLNEADLDGPMQDDLNQLTQYSAKIKAGRAAITAGIQKYGPNSGIDTEALQKGALHQMLYQGGDTLITDPSKLDMSQDYLENEMMAHPKLYVKGDQPMLNTINLYKPVKGGPTNETEHNGITVKNSDANEQIYQPFQHYTTDAKGNRTGIAINSVPAQLDGQTLTDPETKQPMQVVDEPTMRKFASESNAAQIKRDTDDYITDHGMDPKEFQPGTDAYNLLARHVVYNFLNKNLPSEFSPVHTQTESGLAQKREMGMLDALGRTITRSEEQKEQELLGSRNGKIRLAANFDPSVVNAGKPYTTNGQQFIDVTDAVGGFHTLADEKSGPIDTKTGERLPGPHQISRVMVDPQHPGVIYTEEHPVDADGLVDESQTHVVEYKGSDIDALLTRHATANGYKSLKEVQDINEKIPIKVNVQAAREARANLEYQRRLQQGGFPGLNFNQ
jgi:hypothetical protein